MKYDNYLSLEESLKLVERVDNWRKTHQVPIDNFDEYEGSIQGFYLGYTPTVDGFFITKKVGRLRVWSNESKDMCIALYHDKSLLSLEEVIQEKINKPIEDKKQEAIKKAREIIK